MSTAFSRVEDWQEHAVCTGDNAVLFYPPLAGERKKARNIRERRAKNLCAHCPVQQACLDHAIRHDERFGIWGGLNDSERRNLSIAS